jgi:D-sedoheptulose 7-phosphate isomerase
MKKNLTASYIVEVQRVLENLDIDAINQFVTGLGRAWSQQRSVFLCGNGGSAGNAIHLANDFLLGLDKSYQNGLAAEALSANPSVITCLANDVGYESIYSYQLKIKAKKQDLLWALSGSGNSANIIEALRIANELGMETYAIVGFDGGRVKRASQYVIHCDIPDMQIAEDMQLVIGHICMRQLRDNPPILVK